MLLVLDASVAVAAVRAGEPGHAAARARLNRVLGADDTIVVPSIFLMELGSARARRGEPESSIFEYVSRLSSAPHRIVTLGPRSAEAIMRAAVRHGLRGADAAYVWLAERESLPLCTLDNEMIQRGATACKIIAP